MVIPFLVVVAVIVVFVMVVVAVVVVVLLILILVLILTLIHSISFLEAVSHQINCILKKKKKNKGQIPDVFVLKGFKLGG